MFTYAENGMCKIIISAYLYFNSLSLISLRSSGTLVYLQPIVDYVASLMGVFGLASFTFVKDENENFLVRYCGEIIKTKHPHKKLV